MELFDFSQYKLIYAVDVYLTCFFCNLCCIIIMYRKAAKPIIHSCYMRPNCTMLFKEGVCVLSTYKSYFADCHTIICVVIVAILNPCSWYCKHKMVRHWWRWKHSCYRFTRTKPWRSVCLLWPEILTEDGLDASGSDGNNSSSTSLGFIY